MIGIIAESGDFIALVKRTPLNLEVLRKNAFSSLNEIDKFNSFFSGTTSFEFEQVFCTVSGRYIWLINLPDADTTCSTFDLVPFIESISPEDVEDIVENSEFRRHRSTKERSSSFDFEDVFEYVLTSTEGVTQEAAV